MYRLFNGIDCSSSAVHVYSRRLNKWFTLKVPKGYTDRQTPEGGRRVGRLKRCDNNKDEEKPDVDIVNNDDSSAHK